MAAAQETKTGAAAGRVEIQRTKIPAVMTDRLGFLSRPAFCPPLPHEIIEGLYHLTLEAAQRAARARLPRRAPKTQRTLRPGPDTPLWNELVRQVRPHLRRRGSKNLLAHLLGIPRQRLYVCLKAKSGFLDAERTLLLLAWVQARQQGRTLTA